MTIINKQLGWNPNTSLWDLLESTLTYQHRTYAEVVKKVIAKLVAKPLQTQLADEFMFIEPFQTQLLGTMPPSLSRLNYCLDTCSLFRITGVFPLGIFRLVLLFSLGRLCLWASLGLGGGICSLELASVLAWCMQRKFRLGSTEYTLVVDLCRRSEQWKANSFTVMPPLGAGLFAL
ncbi:hypothetical protein Fmac_001553 [Flemingia macrophylla]|uniref:Uncharacterized protein n=1 Tax=Flemingia macrophylla TaxID=520843 RepID=A0ABD1NJ44_9FABA